MGEARGTLHRGTVVLLALILAACAGAPSTPGGAPGGSSGGGSAAASGAATPLAGGDGGAADTPAAGRTAVRVFAAGSLIIPFGDLEKAFEARYPQYDVLAEYHGSIQVIRHVSELRQPIDVVATADASLIPLLLYRERDPDTGRPYGDWYVRFATNRVAIAYTGRSRYASEITGDNWYDVLSRPDVRVGLSDPRFDALGYRAFMVLALANDYYRDPRIYSRMFGDAFVAPVALFQDEEVSTVTVPEIVETKADSGIVMRGASMQVLALLQSGDVDYAFEYESVIEQRGLRMLGLPDAINLGSQSVDYGSVEVSLDFQRFASVKPVFSGERIAYGITVPTTAPDPEGGRRFVEFLLGPEGRAVMLADHHPLFERPGCDGSVPDLIRSLCG
jgi:molybdate/tungstate transport system substrate-binding protein